MFLDLRFVHRAESHEARNPRSWERIEATSVVATVDQLYPPTRRPELIIVLVDADGDPSIEKSLESDVADMPGTKVIAVAVQEFEAWLLDVPNVESLKPREAKDRLAQVTDSRDARKSIAETVELDVLAKRCPSFAQCLKKLRPA